MNWKIVECELAFIAGIVLLLCFGEGSALTSIVYFFGIMIIVFPLTWLICHSYYQKREEQILEMEKEREKLKRELHSLQEKENIQKELHTTIENLKKKVEDLEKASKEFDKKLETELKKFYLIILAKHASGSSKTLKASFEDMKSLYEEYKDITSD